MDIATIEDTFVQYLKLKSLADDTAARANTLKAELAEAVDALGTPDDRGHLWLDLSGNVEGFVALQRQKRVSQSLDEQTADRILSERGIRERCIKTVEVLDEDAVMAALYEGVLSEQDIDEMFPKKVVWAFVPTKA